MKLDEAIPGTICRERGHDYGRPLPLRVVAVIERPQRDAWGRPNGTRRMIEVESAHGRTGNYVPNRLVAMAPEAWDEYLEHVMASKIAADAEAARLAAIPDDELVASIATMSAEVEAIRAEERKLFQRRQEIGAEQSLREREQKRRAKLAAQAEEAEFATKSETTS